MSILEILPGLAIPVIAGVLLLLPTKEWPPLLFLLTWILLSPVLAEATHHLMYRRSYKEVNGKPLIQEGILGKWKDLQDKNKK